MATPNIPDRPGDVAVDTDVAVRASWVERVRRASWGAIFAGLVAAVSCQLLLSVLGLAVGFWSINPATEAEPLEGIATGAGIWWVVSSILSLLLGGWVAGRLAGVPNALDGAVHGLVCWGLVTVLSFYLVGTTIGSVLSATASALGRAMNAAGDAVAAAVPDVNTRGGGGTGTAVNVDRVNINYEAIGNALRETLRETGQKELQPDQLRQAMDNVVATAKDAAAQALRRPDTARRQLDRVLDAFYAQLNKTRTAVNQEALVNVITKNSDMSEAEARRVVNRWQNEYQESKRQLDRELTEIRREVKQEAKETLREAEQTARATAQDVTEAIAAASFWTFVVMLLGVAAAMGGGALGAPRRPMVR